MKNRWPPPFHKSTQFQATVNDAKINRSRKMVLLASYVRRRYTEQGSCRRWYFTTLTHYTYMSLNFGWAASVEYLFWWHIEFNQMVSWYIWWRRVWHKFWMGSTADVWSRRQFYSCPLPQSVSSSQCWKDQMQIYFNIFHCFLLKSMLKLAGKYFLLGLSCPNNFFISSSQHWEVHANAFKTTL